MLHDSIRTNSWGKNQSFCLHDIFVAKEDLTEGQNKIFQDSELSLYIFF
jgi:hypothetical protein